MSRPRFAILTVVLLSSAYNECAADPGPGDSRVELWMASGHRVTGQLLNAADSGPLHLVSYSGSTRIQRALAPDKVKLGLLNGSVVSIAQLRWQSGNMTRGTTAPAPPHRVEGYSTIAQFVNEVLGFGRDQKRSLTPDG